MTDRDNRDNILKDGETVCDLQRDGLVLIQSDKVFHFGTDAVLLSDFAKIKKGASVIDLGTGTGILPILLSAKTKAEHFTGVEIQEDSADSAMRSVLMNGLEEKISIICEDVRNLTKIYGKGSFDVAVTNPPYKSAGTGIKAENEKEYIARHEVKCTLEDFVRVASELLKPNGDFYMVNRPERLADAIEYMRKYKVEPKELQFASKDGETAPVMFLIHGVRLGGRNLKVLPNVFLFGEGR